MMRNNNLTRKQWVDLALIIILSAMVIGGLLTVLLYGDAFGEVNGNVHTQDADMDIDFIPQSQMLMTVESRHEFEDFDRVDDGIDRFYSTAQGERCSEADGSEVKFVHSVRVSEISDSVMAVIDAPETIYCWVADPPFIITMTFQGWVVNIDGNGIGEDYPMAHMRDSDRANCDPDKRAYFDNYEINAETTGWVEIDMLYKEGWVCDGILNEGGIVAVQPDYRRFAD